MLPTSTAAPPTPRARAWRTHQPVRAVASAVPTGGGGAAAATGTGWPWAPSRRQRSTAPRTSVAAAGCRLGGETAAPSAPASRAGRWMPGDCRHRRRHSHHSQPDHRRPHQTTQCGRQREPLTGWPAAATAASQRCRRTAWGAPPLDAAPVFRGRHTGRRTSERNPHPPADEERGGAAAVRGPPRPATTSAAREPGRRVGGEEHGARNRY